MRDLVIKFRLVILLLPLAGWLLPKGAHSKVDSANTDPSASLRSVGKPDPATQTRLSEAYGRLPLSFEANHGQMPSEVKFFSRGNGYTIFLTSTEAVLSLTRGLQEETRATKARGRRSTHSMPLAANHSQRTDTLRMKLIGANQKPEITGQNELPAKVNYFIGNDPNKWRANITTYAKVKYRDVYPGINLVHYGNQRQLEYDFMVAPGADPRLVQLGFEGAEKMEIDARGNLVLHTPGGEVRQHKPIVYQEAGGVRKEIQGSYVLNANKTVGFEIGTYDSSKLLVIDPVLSYSTYLGGNTLFPSGGLDPGQDSGLAIAVDSGGSAYVTGSTRSTNFPTVNPIQASGHGTGFSQTDAFVTKLDPTGAALVYSTYLGGDESDQGQGIAVDSTGNAYITGFAFSSNFPTLNPLTGVGGGAFVTKLNASGSQLVYSTRVGGVEGKGIAVDFNGDAWVTGRTSTPNFPTVNAFQAVFGGVSDAFVAELNATGSAFLYWSYLGGSGFDWGSGIALDNTGNPSVAGTTDSLNFPTVNPVQAQFGGLQDAFVTRLNTAGSVVYSTYLGGHGLERANSIAVDSSGSAFVTGWTTSPDFPTTQNVFQPDVAIGLFKTTSAGQNWFASDSGLGNRSVLALALDRNSPSTIYAGAPDGVFKSTDGGETWVSSNSGMGNQRINALGLGPGKAPMIFAGTNGAGIYGSRDGGAIWTAMNAGLPDKSIVRAIAVDPHIKPPVVYAGTFATGVFKSTDGGLTWTDSSTGLTSRNVSALAIDPKEPSTLYAGTGSGVFKSIDAGANWAPASAGLCCGISALAIDPRRPSTLYAGNFDRVFKTTNGGADWILTGGGFRNVSALVVDPDQSSTVYAGATYTRVDFATLGVFKSTDGGGTWNLMSQGLARRTNVAAMAIDAANPANLYAGIVGYSAGFTGFVTKLNPPGSTLAYSTYLGAQGSGIAVDSAGNAYVTGVADFGYPLLDPLPFMGPGPGAFLTKLSAAGSSLIYSSYLGGFGSQTYPDSGAFYDVGNSVAVDSGGNAYITGVVENSIFPVLNPIPFVVSRGSAFVTKVSDFTPAPPSTQPRDPIRWTVTAAPSDVITTGQSEVVGTITMMPVISGKGTKGAAKFELLYSNPGLQIDNGLYTGIRLLFTPGFSPAFTATSESGLVGIVAVENRSVNGQCYGAITINMAAGATVHDGDFIRIEGVRARIGSSAAVAPGTDIYVDLQPKDGPGSNVFTPNRVKVATSFDAFSVSPVVRNGDQGVRIQETFAGAFLDMDANGDGTNLNDRLDSGGGNLLTTVGSLPIFSVPQALGLPSTPTRFQVRITNIPPEVSNVTFPLTIPATEQSGALLVRDLFTSYQNPVASTTYTFRTADQAGASDLLLESFDLIPVYTLRTGGTGTGLGHVSISLTPGGITFGDCAAPNPRNLNRPRFLTTFISPP